MKAVLANFQTLPLKDAARQLLTKLGYKSDKFIPGAGSSPQAFLDLFGAGHAFDPASRFDGGDPGGACARPRAASGGVGGGEWVRPFGTG